MIPIKSADDLARMRASCAITAQVRDSLAATVAPGSTTKELDEYAAELIAGFGAESAFLGYRGFAGHVCISVDNEVVHGVPGKRRIELGNIVSIDVGVRYDGFIGDTAVTVMIGVTDPAVIQLVKTTEQALMNGIAKARSGGHLSDISHAVERTAVGEGFSVVREFVGHGIGRDMHEDPQIPNFGKPGRGPVLEDGMTLAIEPMINMGGAAVETLADDWTVSTRDRFPSAHFEHTIAISGDRAEILTVSQKKT